MVYTDNSKILPNNIDLLECDTEYVGTVFLPFRFKFKHESCFSTFQNKVAAVAIHYKIKNFFMSVPMFFLYQELVHSNNSTFLQHNVDLWM